MFPTYQQSPTYKAYLRNQGQTELSNLQSHIQPDLSPLASETQGSIDSLQSPMGGQSAGMQNKILGKPTKITQKFGNSNPGVEVFSHGVNSGADFAADPGTSVALPGNDTYKVLQAYNQDRTPGHIGDNTNNGYGNSLYVQDQNTGEKLRFSHLSQLNAQPGQTLPGGSVFGSTGATGNVTGPHLDLEYYDPNGQLKDIMASHFASYLDPNGQGGGSKGGGNPLARFRTMGMHTDDIQEVNKLYALHRLFPEQITPDKYAGFENLVDGLSNTYLDDVKKLKNMSLTDKLEALYQRGQEDTRGNVPSYEKEEK